MRAVVLLVVVALATLVGCDDASERPAGGGQGTATTTAAAPNAPSTAPTPTEPPAAPAPPTSAGRDQVLVYLVRGETVGVARRRIAPTRGVAQAALGELLSGPSVAEEALGLGSEIPAGARLNGVRIAGGTATVDLSPEFEAGGGSLSLRLRVAQVVHTATQFPTVRRVAFAIEGEPVEALGGEGLLVDPPLTRADLEDLAPAILLEQPAPGDGVGSPIRLRGTANVFEASFAVRLTAADGTVLARAPATARSGTGIRGRFALSLPYEVDAPTDATLRVFSDSPRDGSEINVVEIPLRLQ